MDAASKDLVYTTSKAQLLHGSYLPEDLRMQGQAGQNSVCGLCMLPCNQLNLGKPSCSSSAQWARDSGVPYIVIHSYSRVQEQWRQEEVEEDLSWLQQVNQEMKEWEGEVCQWLLGAVSKVRVADQCHLASRCAVM
jgi:hypothetical protein